VTRLRLWQALRRLTVVGCIAALLLSGVSAGLAQGTAPDLTFAVFGDCQPGGVSHSPVLRKLVVDMAEQRPAFVLGCGDYIDGSKDEQIVRRQWQGFFEGISPLQALGRIPVALAPGNHDIMGTATNQAIFAEYFGGPYLSFNRAGCHFVILNTQEPGNYGRIAGPQLEWLKADLAAHRGALLTFVAMHQPLFPVDGHRGESLDVFPRERDALHALFSAEGVDCVFHGHEHLFHRQQIGGIDYVITGGAGGALYARPEEGGFHHYCLLRVHGGGYQLQVRRL